MQGVWDFYGGNVTYLFFTIGTQFTFSATALYLQGKMFNLHAVKVDV